MRCLDQVGDRKSLTPRHAHAALAHPTFARLSYCCGSGTARTACQPPPHCLSAISAGPWSRRRLGLRPGHRSRDCSGRSTRTPKSAERPLALAAPVARLWTAGLVRPAGQLRAKAAAEWDVRPVVGTSMDGHDRRARISLDGAERSARPGRLVTGQRARAPADAIDMHGRSARRERRGDRLPARDGRPR